MNTSISTSLPSPRNLVCLVRWRGRAFLYNLKSSLKATVRKLRWFLSSSHYRQCGQNKAFLAINRWLKDSVETVLSFYMPTWNCKWDREWRILNLCVLTRTTVCSHQP